MKKKSWQISVKSDFEPYSSIPHTVKSRPKQNIYVVLISYHPAYTNFLSPTLRPNEKISVVKSRKN